MLLAREEGQGLVEYALIILLIAIFLIVALALLGTRLSVVFSQISSALP
jgi:pilus assembly protein Flp/PilA